MKKWISAIFALILSLALCTPAFAAESNKPEVITEDGGSVSAGVYVTTVGTPSRYFGQVKNGTASVTGPGFTAEDNNVPSGAVRLVVMPITNEDGLAWFDGCVGAHWNSTGTFYAVFYEDAKGERLEATDVKLTVQVPGGYENLQVFSLDPNGNGQFVDRFDTNGNSVTFTTNGKLYYGVVHRKGVVDEQITVSPGAPDITLQMTPDEMADAVLTDEEKAYLEDGIDAHIKLTVEDITDTVSASDKQAVESVANGCYTVGEYIDIELLKQIGDRPWENVHETKKPIRITIDIPERLLGVEGREFAIARVHNGAAQLLTDLDNDPTTITFETTEFSTYAILYRDPSSPDKPSNPDNPDNPDNPSQPDNPGNPDTPDKPDNPDTEPGTGKPDFNVPQTGDESNITLWLLLMALSVIGIIAALGRMKAVMLLDAGESDPKNDGAESPD